MTGKYIVQVARFDPSKGVPTVIDSYAEFRRLCEREGILDVPQLCMQVNPKSHPGKSMLTIWVAVETGPSMTQTRWWCTTGH